MTDNMTGNTGSDMSKGLILLVEDIRPNQMIATSLLKRGGYDVDLAENGKQALEAVLQKDYDLVLMDLAMPVMNGFDATGAIRKLPGKKGQVPVVALSANDVPADRKRCIDIGMQDFIGKPINVTELLGKVEKYILTTK